MSDEKSMREELEALTRRLEEREAELDRLESVVDRLENEESRALAPIPTETETEKSEISPVFIQPAEPLVVRDPAIVELLQQSAGSVARFDHLRLSVENLDRKIDTLARELLNRRNEDEASRARDLAAASERRDHLLRLAIMAIFFLGLVLLWALL